MATKWLIPLWLQEDSTVCTTLRLLECSVLMKLVRSPTGSAIPVSAMDTIHDMNQNLQEAYHSQYKDGPVAGMF
jgi:hypothetical protein